MPYYPESETSTVFDISEIELNKDHPLASHMLIAAVGGHDFATNADIRARTGGTFRDMTFPWGFQGSVPFQDPSAVGEFISVRNDTFLKNLYREWTIISGTINVANETTGGGAFFGIGATPTSTFDYNTSGMQFGTFNNTELETIQRYNTSGGTFLYAIYRTSTGSAFIEGTPSAPEAHVYAMSKGYWDGTYLINGVTYTRPIFFYRDGEFIQGFNGDNGQAGSSFLNLMQSSANPSYLSATESSAGTVNQRLYGYHGFTFVFNRYLNPDYISRISNNPMSLFQSRDDIPFAISFVDTTTLDVSVNFSGAGDLAVTADPVATTSVTGEIASSFATTLDGIVVQDFEGTGIHIMGALTFGGAGNFLSDPPSFDYTIDIPTHASAGALVTALPVIEATGNVYTVTGVILTGTGGIITTADATVEGFGGATIGVEDIAFISRSNFLLGQPLLLRTERVRTLRITPDHQLALEFEKPIISVWRVVDILNPDETVFMDDVGVTDGTVSVDMGRAERRTVDITFDNYDRSMSPRPGGFWYDKVIRVRRGIELDNAIRYEFDLGYFMIDRIQGNQTHTTVQVSGRDYAKKMLVSKNGSPINFIKDQRLSQIVTQVCYMSGIPANRVIVPLGFNPALSDVVTFDGDASAWDILKTIVTPYNMDMFFDRAGNLVITPQVDPLTTAAVARFGVGEGNLVSMERSTNDSELFNSITAIQDSSAGTVSGSTPGATVVPPHWTAENNAPGSPTRISAIGRRSKRITSPLITDTKQAFDMANQFLKIAALEQYELQMETLNYPWLDVGNIVVVVDPEASAVDPENYLLTNLDISIELGPMSATAKRITVVG